MMTAIDRASVVFPTPPFMDTNPIRRTATPLPCYRSSYASALVTFELE